MTRDEIWMKFFLLVKEYHDTYGKFPDEEVIYKGETIGKWCKNQIKRYKNGDLMLYRERKLKLIDFKFEMPKKEKLPKETMKEINWNNYLNLLKEYLTEFDEIPCIEVRYKNFDIGLWYASQKLLLENNVMLSHHKESFLKVVEKYM